MEKFYFCNFLENHMERNNFKGITSVDVSAKLSESVQEAEAYLTDKSLKFVKAGESCEGVRFDFIGSFNTENKKFPCTEEELHSTDENPIVLIATKSFRVFSGVPVYLKYIPVKGGVIVALLKGYIEVEDSDKGLIPIARSSGGTLGSVSYDYEAKDMQELNSFRDKDSDILYSDHIVSDCVISVDVSKDGRLIRNAKFSISNSSILCSKVFEDGKAKKEEKARAKEEEKKRKEAERKRFYEEQRKAAEERALLEEEKAKEKQLGKTSKSAKAKAEKVEVGTSGAQSFLAFVNSMKANGAE